MPGSTSCRSTCAAGAILPMRSQLEQYVGELAQNPLDIAVYPGRDADYVLYQDDGVSTQAQNAGAFRTTRISQRTTPGARTVTLTRLQDRYAPTEPYLLLRLLQATSPSAVSVGGVAAPQAASQGLAASAADGFYFDAGLAAVVVKVMDSRPQVSVEVRHAKDRVIYALVWRRTMTQAALSKACRRRSPLPPTFTSSCAVILRPGTDVRDRATAPGPHRAARTRTTCSAIRRTRSHRISCSRRAITWSRSRCCRGSVCCKTADTSVTGGGSMLTAVVHVRDSATAPMTGSGRADQSHDSDLGRNFHFGFPSCQDQPAARRRSNPAPRGPTGSPPRSRAAPDVHRVVLQMRLVDKTERTDHGLKPSGQRGQNGWPVWALDPVRRSQGRGRPVQALLLGSATFATRTTTAASTISPTGGGRPSSVPPPPKALAAAAKAWG